MARSPQSEHAWRSSKEGATPDKRYHIDGVFSCIRYSPCLVVFQSALLASLLLEWELSRVIGYYSEIALKLPPTQMTTRVGLDATCSSNPDDATCRVGCNIEMTLELS